MTNIDLERLAVDREYWNEVSAKQSEFALIRDKKVIAWSFDEPEFWSHEVVPRPPKKAQEAEWVDGLPPVGEEIEVQDPQNGEWRYQGFVTEHKIQICTEKFKPGFNSTCKFRPARTAEQRLRDELKETVRKAYLKGASDHVGGLVAIVDKLIAEGWTKEPKP